MSESERPWTEVLADGKALDRKAALAKKRLNREAASSMSPERLAHIDPAAEVSGWLQRIHGMLGIQEEMRETRFPCALSFTSTSFQDNFVGVSDNNRIHKFNDFP